MTDALPPRNPKRDIFKIKKREGERERGNQIQEEAKQEPGMEIEQHINNNLHNNQRAAMELPDFLRNADNEQVLQMYMRMRQRHFADGAVSINVEPDDLGDNNLELYDNRGINIELPNLNEKLAQQVEYYVEAVNREKFYKINAPPQKIKKDDIMKQHIKRKTNQNKQQIMDINRITEDEMFKTFDNKLSEVIAHTTSKISLLFLFMQGLLAGI
jgi:hypothetical protein